MRIEHVAMYVNDIERSKDFFVKYFGAVAGEKYNNFRSGFTSYFLTFGSGARLEIMQRPSMSDAPKGTYRTGFHHIAICVGNGNSVDKVTARLRNDGYLIANGPRWTGDDMYAAVVVDQEGNEIEILAEPGK
ncbi:MAG: VOC family protein [Selenomonadaceae bacterium]|nr:VOC family protein [Selenomonadaceae bacterium]